MNGLMFLLGLLCLISADILLGIIVFIFYKYMDLRYFNKPLMKKIEKFNEEYEEFNEEKSFWGL